MTRNPSAGLAPARLIQSGFGRRRIFTRTAVGLELRDARRLPAALSLTFDATTIGLAALKSEISHAGYLRSGRMVRNATRPAYDLTVVGYCKGVRSRNHRATGSPNQAALPRGPIANFKSSLRCGRVNHVECMRTIICMGESR